MTNPSIQIIQQQVAEKATTRSDVATINRAIQDLNSQVSRLQHNLNTELSQTHNVSAEAFQRAWQEREKLNELHKNINSLKGELGERLPNLSSSKLSDQEKKEIKGLYSSGLYTQQQLASQYGVKQPTISEIVNND